MLNPQSLLAELVSVPSFSGEEGVVTDFLEGHLLAADLPVIRVKGNLLVDVVGGPGPTLMYASHVDTVPAGQAWSADPFAGKWIDDTLIGLGANDAGASVVAMCCALEKLAGAEASSTLHGTLRLALVVEEETTNAGMAQVLDAIGNPDMAVIGEPTALEVVSNQAGLAILRATWRGRSCHAAHAARVDHQNALLQACRELSHLPECQVFPLPQSKAMQLSPTTLVPAIFQSGDRHNRVPDEAIATFDVRLTSPDTANEVATWLQERLPTAAIEITSDRLRPIDTANDEPLVIAALHAAGRSQAVASNTMSDMALLQGVPAIKCGPGESKRSHAPDEFITCDELFNGVEFYTQLASALLTEPS